MEMFVSQVGKLRKKRTVDTIAGPTTIEMCICLLGFLFIIQGVAVLSPFYRQSMQTLRHRVLGKQCT